MEPDSSPVNSLAGVARRLDRSGLTRHGQVATAMGKRWGWASAMAGSPRASHYDDVLSTSWSGGCGAAPPHSDVEAVILGEVVRIFKPGRRFVLRRQADYTVGDGCNSHCPR